MSVVVPTYQGIGLIERCLDALLGQVGEVLDIIVVDDGSTDATCEAVTARSRVRLFRRSHAGVAAARNVGIDAAQAPFVGFCDQDDEWLPEKAHTQAEHLRTHPDVDVVLCQADVQLDIDERPKWLGDDQRGRRGGVPPLSGLFRSEVLARVGGFVGTEYGNEDFDLLVRLRESGARFEVADDVLMRRHVHDRNASHAFGTYERGLVDVMRRRVGRARS